MDGGSTDGSVDILRANEDLIQYWESKPDKGIYDAWNKAITHIHGEWICFLGADDCFWSESTLEQAVARLAEMPAECRVAYGQVALVNASGVVLTYVGQPWDKVRKRFRQLMALPHQAVMHHRSLFEIYGPFDDRFKIAGDYEFLLRELRDHDACFMPGLVMVAMQEGGISSDPSHSLLSLREARMAHHKLLGGKSEWLWWAAYFKVLFRQCLWHVLGERLTRYVLDVFRVSIGKPRIWTRKG